MRSDYIVLRSKGGLVFRTIKLIQLGPALALPAKARNPWLPWAPAFAGVAGVQVRALLQQCPMGTSIDRSEH